MTPTAENRGLSLGARLFLAFGLVLALAVGGAMVTTYYLVTDIATETVTTSLSNSQSVQRYFRQLRNRQLELIAELISSDPYFGSYINEAVSADDPELAARSIADLLQSKRNEFNLDLAMVLDPDAGVLARTDRPQALGRDLSGHPMVSRAREELVPVSGLWEGSQTLYQATVTPIARGRTVIAYLVAGLSIDDTLANDVKRVSGADVAYLTTGEPMRVLATTLDVPSTDRLVTQLRGEAGMVEAVVRGDEAVLTQQIRLGEDRWILQLSPLRDARGEAFGTAVALTSLDRELAAYNDIPILVLITAVIAVAVALLLSYLISQRILRPVRRLTSAAEAAVDGNYRHQVATERGDEIGRLSRALDSLLSSLREKNDMEDYMADMARHVPEADTRDRTRASDPGAETARLGDEGEGRQAVQRRLGERYELMSELGRGAMGVVYKAHDRKLDEIVAIKMLMPGTVDAASMDQLKEELKLARRITHANVLRTYDFGEFDHTPYISMEYVGGITLRELLKRRGKLPYGAGLRIARQLCAGLQAVHEVGVLHRDIKPGNVILEHRGNAKLMDFGISRQVQAADATETGKIVGTPHYISPEQVRGGQPDARSDIYALGVVLEEMFTGGMPFEGEGTMEVAVARVKQDPIPPSRYWPDIPGELNSIILKCLERDPAKRYQSVEALANELGALRG